MNQWRDDLLELFSEVDPWKLRGEPLKAPADEYSPEVDRLMEYDRPTVQDVLRVFVEMGSTGTPSVGEEPVFGEYPAISERDAQRLAEGIAQIR